MPHSQEFNHADLESIHKHSSHHRPRIEASAVCGCFYCLRTFAPTAISDWVDWPNGDESQPGVTALCPRCGIDAVLPDNVPAAALSEGLLRQMHDYWFERTVEI
jgi:hypothetical protein